jgi:hypothetical protein
MAARLGTRAARRGVWQFNGDMIRMVSWNTAKREWWNHSDEDVDVLLLQEARRPASAPQFEMVPAIGVEWRPEAPRGAIGALRLPHHRDVWDSDRSRSSKSSTLRRASFR